MNRSPARIATLAPGTLADDAYFAIEELIVTLQLEPGTVVTEQALSESVGIGRTPVREAIVRLSQDGLTEVLPRRGIMIQPIEINHLLMALEVRQLLETLIIERAAKLASDADRRRLLGIATEMEHATAQNDIVAFMRADHAFNVLVAAASQQIVAERIMNRLHSISRRLGYFYAQHDNSSIEENSRAHVATIRAVAAGDVENAREKLLALLRISRETAMCVAEQGLLQSDRLKRASGDPL